MVKSGREMDGHGRRSSRHRRNRSLFHGSESSDERLYSGQQEPVTMRDEGSGWTTTPVRRSRTYMAGGLENLELEDEITADRNDFTDDVIFVDMLDSAHLSQSAPVSGPTSAANSPNKRRGLDISFDSVAYRERWARRSLDRSGRSTTFSFLRSNPLLRVLFAAYDRFFPGEPTSPQWQPSSEWDWKRPPDEEDILPEGALIYLALIGALTFAICHGISFSSGSLNKVMLKLSFEYLLVLRVLAAGAAFLVPSYFSEYALGSGIPELKCALTGSFLPNSLSPSTVITRAVGLFLALSSGLSVGRLGPFMHIAGGITSVISGLKIFPSLSGSARYQVQAISAATAAGVGATLGAPVGGSLMSVELMSSYYYVHWLPLAFYCSFTGYFLAVTMLKLDQAPFFYSNVAVLFHDAAVSKMISYVVLGAICGLVGALLVNYTSSAMALRTRYFSTKTRVASSTLVMTAALLHNLICYYLGGIMWVTQQKGVSVLVNKHLTDLEIWGPLKGIGLSPNLQAICTLALFTVIKFLLTGMSLALPIPIGTFGPIFEVGALLGALFGAVAQQVSGMPWLDTRIHAAAGAAALPTGVLHTVSVAVVMLELVGESFNILPIALACITSYFVSKMLTADLFSMIIVKRHLPYVIGLRETHTVQREKWRSDIAGITAEEIMFLDFPFVTRNSRYDDVENLLKLSHWSVCAFLEDLESRYLLGVIGRRTIEVEIKGSAENIRGFDRATSPLPFLQNYDSRKGHPFVDPAPFQVPAATPYWKIATYFQMLGVAFLFVMEKGQCIGLITKKILIDYNHNVSHLSEIRDTEPALDEIIGEAAEDTDSPAPTSFSRWRRGFGIFKPRFSTSVPDEASNLLSYLPPSGRRN